MKRLLAAAVLLLAGAAAITATALAGEPNVVKGTFGGCDPENNMIMVGPENWHPPMAYHPHEWTWYDCSPGFSPPLDPTVEGWTPPPYSNIQLLDINGDLTYDMGSLYAQDK